MIIVDKSPARLVHAADMPIKVHKISGITSSYTALLVMPLIGELLRPTGKGSD
jgi:hypothetical protein